MKKNLVQDTVNKIKQQHIAPEPRWKYLARKYGMWLIFALVISLGAISLSAAFSQMTQLDWDLYRFTHQSILGFALTILPFFWALLMIIFLVLAFLDIRKTENGYRFSRFKIFSIVFVGTLFLGYLVTNAGIGSSMNSVMANNPYMQNMMATKQSQWSEPQNGLISGEIISISGSQILLKDFSGKNWNVIFNEQTLLRPAFGISKGQEIKVIGVVSEGNNFIATEIRPWQGGGMMQGFDTSNMKNMGMMRGVNGNGGSMMNRVK